MAKVPLQTAKQQRLSKGTGRGGRAKGPKLEDQIAELNREFALVMMGDKALVLRETVDFQRTPLTVFLSLASFLVLKENLRVWDDETQKFTGLGHIWKKHPDRRTYDGVAFAPEGGIDKQWFNLWRGFAVEPAPAYKDPWDHARKHFPTLLDHVRKNLAQGDDVLAAWIWGWFADFIQHPERKRETALVVRGRQGSGKSKLGKVVGSLLGPHHVKISKPQHLFGTFNAHMISCLLLQVEEGFWAGDKEAEGILKDLISADTHQLEKKGVDAETIRNLIRVYVTSNNSWVVPAGFEERRFAVIDCGDGNLQDRSYFAQIDKELDEGGRAHLLTFLQRLDLSVIDLDHVPQTEALWEQKVASMNELQHWWFERLQEGVLFSGDRRWLEDVPTARLYNSFFRYFDRHSRSRKPPISQWAIDLRPLLPRPPRIAQKVDAPRFDEHGIIMKDANGNVMMKRVNGWKAFPSLTECRAHWDHLVGRKFDWGEGEAGSDAEKMGGSPPHPAGEIAAARGDNWELVDD